jgi:uncharacterized protein with HEPN domain
MADRSVFRVRDVKQSILAIRQLLADHTFDSMYADIVVRAAFERFLEILSEASRSIPEQWKQEHGPAIPWRQVADLGNILRHAYHRADAKMLWEVYENDLTPLESAIDGMLAEHDTSDDRK